MKRWTLVAIGAAAAVLAGAGIAWWAVSRPPGPEAIAREFLAALADGDGSRALALIDDAPASAQHAAQALASASGRITDPDIENVASADGGSTRVTTSFDLAGDRRTASFGLVERGGTWRVSPDALGVATPTSVLGDTVEIGGVLLPTGEAASLLPGAYQVRASPAGILTGATQIVVLPGADVPTQVEASLAPGATAAAQEQLDAYAQACAKPAGAVPPNCGIRVPWAADLTTLDTIAFRIEQTPSVLIAPDARSFAATGGVLVATATGTARTGGTASFTYRADDWALRGSISFEGGAMILSVD